MRTLQWGGRFSSAPDAELLAFGSSLDDDLCLSKFDAECSRGHVAALLGGGIITPECADALLAALATISNEVETGAFAAYARKTGAEDVHGAIDARVRELEPENGELLHAGRSRNDQVATTLLLYARERAADGIALCVGIARALAGRANEELEAGTIVAGVTHWQPAQPILLAFWLAAGAEMFARAARAFIRVKRDAAESSPLGSGALAGSTLPLDRAACAKALAFEKPSRNALDSVGNRDVSLDLAHACVRALLAASRMSEELVLWCAPAFGYARLGDAASTGSSLMPQKRNPDPFELVRASAADACGRYAGALATTSGLGLSYHRDLQQTKAAVIGIVEPARRALHAFARALTHVTYDRERMQTSTCAGYTVATDVADALIERGVSARAAHALTGDAVLRAERERRPLDTADLQRVALAANVETLDAPLTAEQSVASKRTSGSTLPRAVRDSLVALETLLDEIEGDA